MKHHAWAAATLPVFIWIATGGAARAANSPAIARPQIPKRSFRVTDFGADPTGRRESTEAIQRAIRACEAAGGGRVEIPAGDYLSAPLTLVSHLELRVDRHAVVRFTRDRSRYPLIVTCWEGVPTVRCQSPLYGRDLRDVSITGSGVFDGQGDVWRPAKRGKMPSEAWNSLVASGGYVDEKNGSWWPSRAAADGEEAVRRLLASGRPPRIDDYAPYRDFLRPTLLELDNCRRVLLDGPTFRGSGSWTIHPFLCDDVTIRGVTVRNPWWGQNTDGIDLDSCRRVLVAGCSVSVGDDGICLKSGKDEVGRKLGRPTEDVTIRDCTVERAHGGVTIGSEMSGGVRRVTVRDCVFTGTDIGLRVKSTRGRGGVVEDVDVRGIRMSHLPGPAISFDMYYMVRNPLPEPVSERTPRFRNFTIRDITCEGAKTAMEIRGLPEMPIEGITIENARIRSSEGIRLTDVRAVTLRNVAVRALEGRATLRQERVEQLTLEKVDGLDVQISTPSPRSEASSNRTGGLR